jgi:hypothetical protein
VAGCEAAGQQGQDDVVDDMLGEGLVEPARGHHLAEDLGLDNFVQQGRQLTDR